MFIIVRDYRGITWDGAEAVSLQFANFNQFQTNFKVIS